jgi:hypothetical protein
VNETPIYSHPAIVIFAVTTAISGITAIVTFAIWLIRQEAKIANVTERTAHVENETAQVWKAVQSHKEREDLHFNQAVARQVEEKQDARFARLEGDIKEIKQLLREIVK